jgi:hypothetical protein
MKKRVLDMSEKMMSSDDLINVTLTRGEWYTIEEYLSSAIDKLSTELTVDVDEITGLDFILNEIKKQVC